VEGSTAQFIEHLYEKRFGRSRPNVVLSLEEQARAGDAKKGARKERKLQRQKGSPGTQDSSGRSVSFEIVPKAMTSIRHEVESIVAAAATRTATKIVSLPPLVFFATPTGDAWMLDPEDGLALCLARDGDSMQARIEERPEKYAIEWTSDYRIEGEVFVATDRNSGRVTRIAGYPVAEIASRRGNAGPAHSDR
jgi:hypothetical protein